MSGFWWELGSLVLPVPCAGCGQGRELLCAGCRADLAPGAAVPARPVAPPPGLPHVWAAARYGGPVRGVLLAHKERGALPLAGPLGALLTAPAGALCRAAVAAGPARARYRAGGVVVQLVPVPSGRRAVARRGHDPLVRLARVAAGRLRAVGCRVRVHAALARARPVADQAGLRAAARHANLAGALVARPQRGRWGGPVVLVDDLMTTGASLAEAARAVRAVAPPGLLTGAAVVAAVPARGSRHG